MPFDHELTEDEKYIAASLTYSSWDRDPESHYERSIEDIKAGYCPGEVFSVAAGHPALRSREDVGEFYARRMTGRRMNAETQVEAVHVVGDIAIVAGIFRICRNPERGQVGLDHAGRFLTVLRRNPDAKPSDPFKTKWRTWFDMDTPSPDAAPLLGRAPIDVFSLGWVRDRLF